MPDNGYIQGQEERHSNDGKEKVYRLFKELKIIEHLANLCELDNTDEVNARFIIDSYKKYKDIKDELKEIINKIRDSWKKERDSKEELGYLG